VPAATVLLADRYDGLVADLDGVVYRGRRLLPGVAEALAELARRGVPVAFATNNAARTPQSLMEHLGALGVSVDVRSIVTSAQVAALVAAQQLSAGAAVLVIGGPGLQLAVEQEGLRPVTRADADPQAVVQGFGPDLGWRELTQASYAVATGVPWIATNTDLTIPTEHGIAPGTGTFVAAVTAATGRTPEVVGKPAPALIEAAAARIGASRPLVVGDRLDTDIAAAVAARMDSALVLTGVCQRTDLAAVPTGDPLPTWVAADLLAIVAGRVEAARGG